MTNREVSLLGVAHLQRLRIIIPVFSTVIGIGTFGCKLLDVLVAMGTRDQLQELEAMTLTPVG